MRQCACDEAHSASEWRPGREASRRRVARRRSLHDACEEKPIFVKIRRQRRNGVFDRCHLNEKCETTAMALWRMREWRVEFVYQLFLIEVELIECHRSSKLPRPPSTMPQQKTFFVLLAGEETKKKKKKKLT
jgi:hypothetical protein